MALNSVHSIALSGMQAATQRLGSASHNIANWSTPGFRRELVVNATQAGGGVAINLSSAAEPGVALAEDVVSQKIALYEFKSNMQVFKTQQYMLGALLDLQA